MEKRHSSYMVNDPPTEPGNQKETGWCHPRFMVALAAVASLIIYVMGSIITGVTYRHYDMSVNCTVLDKFDSTPVYVFLTPLVVVGPCFMSAGGAILLFLLFQWVLCRPSLY